MSERVRVVLELAGLVVMVVALALVYVPLGVFVAGAALFWIANVGAEGDADDDSEQ